MPRINIEDDIESRDQFWRLLPLVGGDRDKALGALLRFFRLAIQHYGRGEPMTEATLHEHGLSPMIQAGWAVPVEGGYQALGARKQFGWYRQRVEAGKSRATSPRNADGQFKSATVQRNTSGAPAEHQRKPDSHQPLTLSLSPSLTKTTKQNSLRASPQSVEPQEAPKGDSPGRVFVREYVLAYQKRYGPETRPEITPKVAGQLKRFLASTPLPRAIELIQVYLQMDDRWFLTKCHDVTTFLENLNKVSLARATGEQPGNEPRVRSIEDILADEDRRGHA